MTHVVVTGAAGYIGSRVIREIREQHPGWTVTALDNFYAAKVNEIGDVATSARDILDREGLRFEIEAADAVIHLAALTGVEECEEKDDEAFEVNVKGTANVAWECRKAGVPLVFALSAAVLGQPKDMPVSAASERDPLNWYAQSKVMGEATIERLAHRRYPAHQLMLTNLYGSHVVGGERVTKGTVINFFVERAMQGEPLTVYEPGTQVRNFIHVRDVARAFVSSAEAVIGKWEANRAGATTLAVGTEETLSVMEVAGIVKRAAWARGMDVDIELVENPRGAEATVDHFEIDASRAREKLDWEPQECVRETVAELMDGEVT